jgi:hypothetical protein
MMSAFTLVLLALLFPTTDTAAQTVVLPSADTYTDRNNTSANFGTEQYSLLSASTLGGCTQTTYLWFKFDIPTGTSVEHAALSLTFFTSGAGVSDLELRSSADTSWNEADPGGLNWANQPALDPLVLSTATGAAPGGTVTFQDPDLATYLEAHLGETVSLVVRVDCGGSVAPSVALALETKENPAGAAAELEVTIPTSVTLSSFTATPEPGAIRLDWETVFEVDVLGFNLLRSANPEGERVQINPDIIPAEGMGGPGGATYTYLDDTAAPGATYYYWLEIVNTFGGADEYGPRSATAGYHRMYLPILLH